MLQGFIEVVFSLVRILPDPRLLEIPNKYLQVCSKKKNLQNDVTFIHLVTFIITDATSFGSFNESGSFGSPASGRGRIGPAARSFRQYTTTFGLS